MKIVAVTGASGYLGRKLLGLLQAHPRVAEIVSVDRAVLPEDLLPAAKNRFYRMDIRDPGLSEVFTGHNVDTIIHLAFIVDPIRDIRAMHSINVGGTKNVLAAAEKCGARHLVIASSTSAFGAFPDNPARLAEDSPPRRHPAFSYASDKYAVEQLVARFRERCPEITLAVVRPCIIYGPGVDNYLARFVWNWPFLVQIGRDRPEMQFVHEDDVAALFMAVVERKAGGFFHAVGEGLITTEEIARAAGKKVVSLPAWLAYPLTGILYRLRFPLVEAPAGMLDFIRYRWVASDQKTRDQLGFAPRHTSAAVIEELLKRKRKSSRIRDRKAAAGTGPD